MEEKNKEAQIVQKIPTINQEDNLPLKTTIVNPNPKKSSVKNEQKKKLRNKFTQGRNELEKWTSLFYIIYLAFFVSIIFMQFDVEKRHKMNNTLLNYFVNGTREEVIIKADIMKPLQVLEGISNKLILDGKYEFVSPIRLTMRRIKLNSNSYPITPLVSDTLDTSQWASRGIGFLDPFHSSIEANDALANSNFAFDFETSFFGLGGYVYALNVVDTAILQNILSQLRIQTACLTLDFTLINYELNYTCSIAIKNEFTENGVIKKQFYLYMTNRNLYSTDWEYTRAAFEILSLIAFIFYVICFIISLINKIKTAFIFYPKQNKCRVGLKEIFSNFFILFQIISILFTIVIVILWAAFTGMLTKQSHIIENVYSTATSFTFQQQNDILFCGYFMEIYRGFITVNFLFIFARLVEIICKLIPSTAVFVNTISIAMSDIFSYFVFFVIVLLGFSLFSWIFFCRWLESFGTFNVSFNQNWVFSLGIMNSDLFSAMYAQDSAMTVIYFIVFIVFMRFFVSKIILGIILFYFRKVNGKYIMEKELALEDEFSEANIKPRTFYKVILSYSKLLNTLCDWAICKCKKKQTTAVDLDYSDLCQFNSWTIKNHLCPEIKIKNEVLKDQNSTEQSKIRKVSGMQLYELNYNENYEFDVRNAYFDSEKDFGKVKCYFEMKYRKTVIHFLLYFIFTIFLIVMYLMNCLTPWRWNFYSYLGDSLNNITHNVVPPPPPPSTHYTFQSNKNWNNTLLKQFVFTDFLQLFDKSGTSEVSPNYKFLGRNFVLGDKLLITTKRELIEDSVKNKNLKVRKYEILNDEKLYQEDKSYFNVDTGFVWNYYFSYNKYGGYNYILELPFTPNQNLMDSFLDGYTTFTYIEFFLRNYEYEVCIYVKLKITSDYGVYYIQDYNAHLIKYNIIQMPIDAVKYASELIFLILFIYLIVITFRNIIQESRNYNKWFHDVILPLNLKIKDLRNKAEPELLRKIEYMVSVPRILDISIICLSIGLLACRLQLWYYEFTLNQNLVHSNGTYNKDKMYQLRDLFYSGIYAKNNYEIIGCFVIFLVLIKYISMLDFGQYLSVLKNTFEASRFNTWTFLLILIVIHPAFLFYAHLCFGEKDNQYYKVEASILSILKILCGYINFIELKEANEGLGPLFYFVYFIVVNMILLNFFVAIIATSYDKIKESVIKAYSVYDWKKVFCFCSKLRYKKEQKYTLEAEFEYENQIPKFETGFQITGDRRSVLEWVKYEMDQIKRMDDTLFQMKKKKNDMDLARETSQAEQEFIFEDNLYKNIQYSHYKSFYVYYLNYMLTISEKLEKDSVMLDQSSKHLTEHDEYMNYDMMLENVDKKHNKILEKIAEIDKNFIDMKNDLNKIHELNLETNEMDKEAKKKKGEENKNRKETDGNPNDLSAYSNNSEINPDDDDEAPDV